MKLMGGEIKNLFFNFIWTKKQLILAVLFFVFLGLTLPSQFAQAGFLDVLASIPVMIITLLLQIVLAVSNLALGLAGLILGWVVGPYFTTLPYTHGGIVDVGWPLVRDFINMFFVIALVVIGLATALRIKEYQAQKTLPLLIIIAILINFTPVICGLIVDASNILMNFFLEELTGFQLMKNFFAMQGSAVWQAFSHPFDFRYAVTALGKTIVMIIFDWVAAYTFFIFSLLFIMRYVMIWALVIVSPIAFFSKIFPGSQKYLFKSILGWDEWWEQFIEWSLLGVIAGFFLYLAEQLMMLAPGMISGLPPGQGGGGWVGNPIVEFVNNFLPWMVVLVFLIIGYKIAKSTSAMGAQGLIKAVDTGLKAAALAIGAPALGVGAVAGWAGGRAGLWAKETGAPVARRIGERLAKFPVLGEKIPGRRGKMVRGITKPAAWASRAVGGVMVKPFESGRAEIRKAEEEGRKMRKEIRPIRIKASRSSTERTGLLRAAIKEFDQDYTLEQLGEDKFVKIIQEAKNFEEHKLLTRAFPHLAGKVPGIRKDVEEEAKKAGLTLTPEEIEEKAIKWAIRNITHHPEEKGRYLTLTSLKGGLEKEKGGLVKEKAKREKISDIILENIAKYFDGRLLSGLVEEGGREAVDILMKKFEEIEDEEGNKGLNWFLKHNPAVPLWFATNPAQELGAVSFGGLGRDEVRKKVYEAREEARTRRVPPTSAAGVPPGVTPGIVPGLDPRILIGQYRDLRRKIGDIYRKIEGRPEEETLKEQEELDALKKEADEIWGTIKKDETLYKKWEETERGWRRPPRGGRPPGPPPTPPRAPRRPPSPPTPTAPAATPTPKPTPPTPKAPPQPKAQPQVEEIYPVEVLERQVKEHLENLKRSGVSPGAGWTPPFINAFLRQKGVSQKEIDKMNPREAWAKAEKMLSETPPSSPVTPETRKGIPKREYRKRKKAEKRRREREEEEEY